MINVFDQRGRTLFETLLVLVLVSILMYTFIERYTSSIRTIKENALILELSNLRTAINMYATINGRLPSSLKDLVAEEIVVTKQDLKGEEFKIVFRGRYVEAMTVDEEGYPVDAFGNRFFYDPETGSVHSTTEGYERW